MKFTAFYHFMGKWVRYFAANYIVAVAVRRGGGGGKGAKGMKRSDLDS